MPRLYVTSFLKGYCVVEGITMNLLEAILYSSFIYLREFNPSYFTNSIFFGWGGECARAGVVGPFGLTAMMPYSCSPYVSPKFTSYNNQIISCLLLPDDELYPIAIIDESQGVEFPLLFISNHPEE